MNYPELESDVTVRQNIAIRDALVREGIQNVELVCNPLGEALAVHIKGAFAVGQLAVPAAMKALKSAPEGEYLEQSLPMAGNKVFPPTVLRIIDLAVQAATGRKDVLATNVSNYNALRGADDVGMHVDNIGFEKEKDQLYGLNIHATDKGSAKVLLGMVRRFADIRRIYDTMRYAEGQKLYRELAAPFAEITLNEGDILIFQAGHHRTRGRLPIAHQFTTNGEGERLYALFNPSAEQAAFVESVRADLARLYDMAALGYDFALSESK